MRRALLPLLLLSLFLLSGAASAQQRLVLNGTPVTGLTTELVPGTAYIPAEAYARALGATYRFAPQTGLLLDFGGRYLTLLSFVDAAQAALTPAAMVLDGRALPGPGAVVRGNTAYLPVKSVTAALGGQTAYLSERQTVAVVFPRPQLLTLEPPGVWGSFERFVLTFSAPVNVETLYEASLRVARFRFPRAEMGNVASANRLPPGSRFSDAAFIPENGYLDFNLTLREGNDYSVFHEPTPQGERVVIDVFNSAAAQTRQPTLRLGASGATVALARRLQAELELQGVEVELFTNEAGGAQAGFAAPFLLSLKTAPLEAGWFNLYYLSGAAPTLSAPLRLASAEPSSAQGQGRGARLQANLELGERAAHTLADALEARTTLRRENVLAAPLLLLSGAAGRGVMLELSPQDSADPALAATLARSVAALARRP